MQQVVLSRKEEYRCLNYWGSNMKHLLFWLASVIMSIGIGFNARQSDFKLIRMVANDHLVQLGCMKGLTYLEKSYKLPDKSRVDAIYYCNKVRND